MKKIISEKEVLNYIMQNIEVELNDIVKIFSISSSTAHRILRKLGQSNWVDVKQNTIYYKPFTLFNYDDKNSARITNALSYRASKMINSSDSVGLIGGSTTVASILPFLILENENITIISNNSLALQYYLMFKDYALSKKIHFFVIGGTLRDEYVSFGGEYSEEIIKHFTINKCFIGTQSVDIERGLFTNSVSDRFVETSFIQVAEKAYIVTAATKFNVKKFYRWASWSEFDGIITDYDVSLFKNKENFDAIQVNTNIP